MLLPFLNPDPLALETHAPLLVRMRVHRRLRPRVQLDAGRHQVRPAENPGPDTFGQRPRNASLAMVVEPLPAHPSHLLRPPAHPRATDASADLRANGGVG